MDSRDLAWENLTAGRDRRKVRGTLAASGDLQGQSGNEMAAGEGCCRVGRMMDELF